MTGFSDWNSGVFCFLTYETRCAFALPSQSVLSEDKRRCPEKKASPSSQENVTSSVRYGTYNRARRNRKLFTFISTFFILPNDIRVGSW